MIMQLHKRTGQLIFDVLQHGNRFLFPKVTYLYSCPASIFILSVWRHYSLLHKNASSAFNILATTIGGFVVNRTFIVCSYFNF